MAISGFRDKRPLFTVNRVRALGLEVRFWRCAFEETVSEAQTSNVNVC